jgi:peptide/nickel transport system substrate-binding protein
MRRRDVLLGAAAATLAAPAVGRETKTLSFVPQANLNSIDPVWTTATVTRNFGLMVFEMLYGRDINMVPRPQMLEGALVDLDGKRWTMTLRRGQFFHDGTPVLARDCIASLQRWAKRDPIGATIMARTDEFVAVNDRTIRWRMQKPFPALPKVLSKNQTSPVIMPERLAMTDPFKQIPEAVGSGAFRFLANEQVIGSRAVFEKFEQYQPRQEPTDFTSGGRAVHLDRVVWHMIPDGATAANALATGEIDWVEMPLPDLMPMLRKQANVQTGRIDPHGIICALRPNHLTVPTNNVGVRRAMLAAIDQREVMTAIMGDDPAGWEAPIGYLMSGKPDVDNAGMDFIRNRPSRDAIRGMLDKAGYNNERIVLLHPTDQSFYSAACSVAAQAFASVGLNIDDQAMDWGTVVQRRPSKEPVDKGGWSLFPSGLPAAEYRDPLLSNVTRSNGKDAWFGWPDDPAMERIYETWVDSTNPAEQTRLERDFQLAAFATVPFFPLGRYLQESAWSRKLDNIPRGPAPLFWNVTKS